MIGYYCLSAGVIGHGGGAQADPAQHAWPAAGPPAWPARCHNRGLGQSLLCDAMIRAVSVAGDAGVLAILVHALSDDAGNRAVDPGEPD